MCCVQTLELPQPSVALQMRLMAALPVQLVSPAVSVKVIVTGWAQLSVAVAAPVLLVAVEPPQARSLSAGQVITGVVSLTVMVWTQLELALPHPSVAMNRRLML